MPPNINIKTDKERKVRILFLNFIVYLLMQNENMQKGFSLKIEYKTALDIFLNIMIIFRIN